MKWQTLMPTTMFGRLFGLVFIAVLSSHLLFALAVSFRDRYQPPFERGLPRMNAERIAPPPGEDRPPPRNPSRQNRPIADHWFWLGIGIQCGLVLLAARLGSRMMVQPIERLAEAAMQLGDNLQKPPLAEEGPLEARMATRGFNQMQIKLAHQLNERGRFLMAVSHDLRTPLTRLRLRFEQLPESDLQQKMLNDWRELSHLVNSTLDYVRGQQQLGDIQNLDIEALLSAMVEDRQEQGQAITLTGQSAPIKTRPDALRRCLQNIVDNAIHYGGQAEIQLLDSAQALIIRVRDQGPGIPEMDLARVTEPFVRLEESRNRNTGGLGLGLSIAKDAARGALGVLELRNHPEGGLVVDVKIERGV